MAYQYTSNQPLVLLGSTSTATSVPVFVGDFRRISFSWASSASLGASRFTIWASNSDGLQNTTNFTTNTSQSTGWSLFSGVNMVGAPGVIGFDAGCRWARVSVDVTTQSVASYTTITFFGQTW